MDTADPDANISVTRVWEWGFHEDGLFVNRLPFIVLAETLLINAAVFALFAATLPLWKHLLAILIEVVGIALTLAMWYTQILHNDHIVVLGEFLTKHDPIHQNLTMKMKERRRQHIMWRLVFRDKGTKWIQTHVTHGALLLFWTVLFAMTLALSWTPKVGPGA